MSRRQLMQEMDAREVLNWMSYEMSIEPEQHKKYVLQMEEERAKLMSDEERAQAIKDMLNMVSGIK